MSIIYAELNNNAARQDLTLEFADDGLNLWISGVGQFARQWGELSGITDTDKGIRICLPVRRRLLPGFLARGSVKSSFDRPSRRLEIAYFLGFPSTYSVDER